MSQSSDTNQSPCAPVGCSRRAFLARATLASLGMAVGMSGLPSELLARAPLTIQSLGTAGGWQQYQVPASDGVYVDSANDLLLARAGGSVYALSARCTHRGSARVAWQPSAGRFQCPKHKAIFSRDGVLQSGKPSRSLDRFAIRRTGTAIDVDLTTVFQEDTDPAAWEAAVVAA